MGFPSSLRCCSYRDHKSAHLLFLIYFLSRNLTKELFELLFHFFGSPLVPERDIDGREMPNCYRATASAGEQVTGCHLDIFHRRLCIDFKDSARSGDVMSHTRRVFGSLRTKLELNFKKDETLSD